MLEKVFKKSKGNKGQTKSISSSRPWLKSYPDFYSKTVDCEKMTMVEFIEKTAEKYPNQHCFQYFGKKTTYKSLMKKIDEVAKSLRSIGVTEKDKVTICMPNTPEAIIMFYAINKIGAVANMIHPLSAEKEIEYYLNVAESKYILTIDISLKKVMNIINNTKVKKVILASPSDGMGFVMKNLYKLTKGRGIEKVEHDKVIYWADFISQGKTFEGKYEYKRRADELAIILYSGGTTGSPKGIMLSNHNANILTLQIAGVEELIEPGDTMLTLMPIFHCFGLCVCVHFALTKAMKCLLVPQIPKGMAKFVVKNKVSVLIGVPTLFENIYRNNNYKGNELKHVKLAVSGGDALSDTLRNEMNEFLRKHGSKATVRVGYGMTESSGPTCAMPPVCLKNECIGLPLPGMTYKIVKVGTHEECGFMEEGEICVSGPTVMMGYLNNEEETYQTLREHEDGITWLHTGDIGCIDEDGYIYFKQRLKRMIISSGYNVYPSHIEKVLNEHESVLMSTVIGVDHPYKMQVAKAYVVLKEGYEVTTELENEIKEHCKKHLAKWSVPAYFEFRDSLPKTLLGKVSYRELEAENKK